MKISELKFKPNPYTGGKQARIHFENGYGASVITGGSMAQTSERLPYEIAVLKGDDLCYDTPITSDVLAYQSARNVEIMLKRISELPKEMA